ncbi:MAG: phytanoyl-CoA dioxygenase family protein [bacterium]|nr:phytanoyl-CoA dioxygenase family protein [bacterium]
MFTDKQLDHYRTEGFVIVDDVVDPDMLARLLEAAKRVKQKVRVGEVDIYTHWAGPGEPWAIRGLFAPEIGEPDFADYLLTDPVMKYVQPILGDELRLGGVLIFTNPYDDDYGFGWHRDSVRTKAEMGEEEELELLNPDAPMNGLRWHLALVDDACLMVVPGSHRRYRTPHELQCLTEAEVRNEDISGQYAIPLKAGQAAFWNGKIIHRGVMKKDVERLTLSCSWSKHSEEGTPKDVDPRLRWLLANNVRDALPEEMQVPYDRWRALQVDY